MEKYWYEPIIQNKERYYRLAFSYVKNEQDAMDIVQESILKAIKQKSSINNKEFITTWFYRVVINTSLNFIRKNSKIIYLDDDSWGTIADTKDFSNLELKEAIDALPFKYKTIIILRFFEDLKLEEIADILQENTNTIKSRLYTALKRLKVEMDDEKREVL